MLLLPECVNTKVIGGPKVYIKFKGAWKKLVLIFMFFATFGVLFWRTEGMNFMMAGINFWPMNGTFFSTGAIWQLISPLSVPVQVPKLGLSKSQNRDTLPFLQVTKIVVSKSFVDSLCFGLVKHLFLLIEWNQPKTTQEYLVVEKRKPRVFTDLDPEFFWAWTDFPRLSTRLLISH